MIKITIELPVDPNGRIIELTPEQVVKLYDELDQLCGSVSVREVSSTGFVPMKSVLGRIEEDDQ